MQLTKGAEVRAPRHSASLLFALALLAFTCDGYLGVEGRVYQTKAGELAKSRVLVGEVDFVPPADLVPLSGAEILLEPWTPAERAKRRESNLWTSRATSDTSGYFKAGGTAKPAEYDVTITVRRDGFKSVERVFRHDRFRHQAVVILVPERALLRPESEASSPGRPTMR
jgi:hypothetical protein